MDIMQKLIASSLVVAAVVLGVVIMGRLADTDVQAMVATTVFLAALAGGLLLVVRRHRELLVWVAVPFLVTAGAAGIWLSLPLVTERTVDEQIVTVQEDPGGNNLIASGQFEAASHPGSGTASLLGTPEGTVLTFEEFRTDNGPDLLVYLVPADAPAGSDDGAVNLGALKGNRGDQQYAVPDDVDVDAGWRVVVWCRAFAVSFTEAPLA
jgi:hypothetical protein